MAKRFDVLVPLNQFFRRPIEVASGLVSAGTEGDLDISLAPDQVSINDGEWVTLDSDQKAIKASGSSSFAWPCWTSGTRYDVRASKIITVIFGIHWATTAVFDKTSLTTVGQELTLGTADGKLKLATSSDRVFAFLEKIPGRENAQFTDGYIDYNTLGAGYVKA